MTHFDKIKEKQFVYGRIIAVNRIYQGYPLGEKSTSFVKRYFSNCPVCSFGRGGCAPQWSARQQRAWVKHYLGGEK